MNMDKIKKIEKLKRHRVYFKDFSSKRKLLDHVIEVVDDQFQKINELISALQDEPKADDSNNILEDIARHVAETLASNRNDFFIAGYNQAIEDAIKILNESDHFYPTQLGFIDELEQLKKNNK